MAEKSEWLEALSGPEPDGGESDGVATLDPMAASLAASASRAGEPLPPALERYLDQQRALVAIQSEHLHEQRAVVLANLKLKRWSERLRLCLQAALALAALAVVIAVAAIVWQGADAKGLVLEAFSSPPDFAREGLTGQVLAQDIEDRIEKLQTKTKSGRAASSFAQDWSRRIDIEIPETGVSLGEAQRIARDLLGREQKVTGALVRTPQGLSLVARLEGHPPVAAKGADIDALLDQVAEGLYAQGQPYRYATYLMSKPDTRAAGVELMRQVAETGDRDDRAFAQVVLNEGPHVPLRVALAQSRELAAQRPDLLIGAYATARLEEALGHEETALADFRGLLARFSTRNPGAYSAAAATVLLSAARGKIDETLRNYRGSALDAEAQRLRASVWGHPEREGHEGAASAAAGLHDLASARRERDAGDPSDHEVVNGNLIHPRTDVAMAESDWNEALRQMDGLEAEVHRTWPGAMDAVQAKLWPLRVVALIRLGRRTEADALAARLPADSYEALQARGTLAAMEGDASGSERWFAAATAAGPSLPAAFEAWGEARLERGDLSGAAELFHKAATRGPQWADPLKGLGDVALRRGRWGEARSLYDKALALAPAWAELQAARSEAARHQG